MGAKAPASFLQKPEEDPPDIEALIAAFPRDCQDAARLMYQIFNLLPPEKPPADKKGGVFGLWKNGLRSLERLARQYNTPLERAMRLTWQVWNNRPFTLSHPFALHKTMTSALARANMPKPVSNLPSPAHPKKPDPVTAETEARMRALDERLKGAYR
jgi:hypothetical protein